VGNFFRLKAVVRKSIIFEVELVTIHGVTEVKIGRDNFNILRDVDFHAVFLARWFE
jgi:hypothetical protein